MVNKYILNKTGIERKVKDYESSYEEKGINRYRFWTKPKLLQNLPKIGIHLLLQFVTNN